MKRAVGTGYKVRLLHGDTGKPANREVTLIAETTGQITVGESGLRLRGRGGCTWRT